MTPKFEYLIGYGENQRLLKLQLPLMQRNIGVLVSGGLDSALLYFLLNSIISEKYKLTPFILNRNDGSNIHAKQVLDYLNEKLNIKRIPIFIEITEQDSNLQVTQGIETILYKKMVNVLYVGLIETLPEHSIGVPGPFKFADTQQVKVPFANLNKSHIVSCIHQLELNELFNLTHSCVYPIGRCNVCNRCVERKWAFDFNKLIDTGTN